MTCLGKHHQRPAASSPGPLARPNLDPGDPPAVDRRQRWRLVRRADAVAVVTDSETVAEAHIWERDGLVILEFWMDGAEVPHAFGVGLVEQAFDHPAVRADRAVLACVPSRGGELLEQACRHIDDARTRPAGLTCLIEGRVRRVSR